MPFISDQQIARLQSAHANVLARVDTAKKKAMEKAGEIKEVCEIVGGAGAIGFARGKLEDASGAFNIPGTSIDVELVVGMGLVGAGMMDALGKYDNDAIAVGSGVLAHYVGQITRKWAKTGTFSPIAGI